MISLIPLYDETTGLVDERRAGDVVSLGFRKAFGTLSLNILMVLMKYRSEKWTVRWTENWLNCRAQTIVISGMKSSWRPVTADVPQMSRMRQVL